MTKSIIIVSCKRSGHHAVINWLLTNYNDGRPVDNYMNSKYNYLPVRTNESKTIIYLCHIDNFFIISSN